MFEWRELHTKKDINVWVCGGSRFERESEMGSEKAASLAKHIIMCGKKINISIIYGYST